MLDKLFGCDLDLRQWFDPMIVARYLSFPGSLGAATEALGLTTAKDKRGKELIRRSGQLPGFRAGKHWRIRESDLLAWIDRQVLQSTSQPNECGS